MESEFQCPVHMTRFSTVDHPLVVLASCAHSNCKQHLVQELDNRGHFLCPVCRVVVFPPIDKATNEVATYRANVQLAATEIQCEVHRDRAGAKVLGEFFCSESRAVYCDACRHKEGACCRKPDCMLAVEVMIQLRELANYAELPANVKLKLRLAGDQDAQVNYNLLRTCVNLIEGRETGMKCLKHSNKPAKYIHEDSLKVYCAECEESILSLELLPQNSVPLRKAIGKYLLMVHCYSVPPDVLRSLQRYQDLKWAEKVELAASVGEIRKLSPAPVPSLLCCGACLQFSPSLRVLHARHGKHAVCYRCATACRTNFVCPLDGEVIEVVGDEELNEVNSAPTKAEYLEDRRDEGQYGRHYKNATHFPYWRGTSIPRPTILKAKCIQRFFAVYPPVHAQDDQYDPSMQGWCINLDPRQVEPVVLSASESVTLVGVTVAASVERSTRIYLKSVSISEGRLVRNGQELLSAPVPLCGGRVATDVLFGREAAINAGVEYTLSLTLAATTSHPVITFRGNHYTAPDSLISIDNVYWCFRRCEDYSVVTGGDNARSGPLLRLFYR